MEKQKVKNRTELLVYILAILGLVAVVNYLGVRWFKRIDMTEGREYSVSAATKKVLRSLDDIVNIKVYFSKDLPPHLHKTVTDVKDLLFEYQAYAGKNLRITWEDPAESEETKNMARSLGIPEVQLQTFEKDKQQVMNGYLGIAVLFEDKKEALPVVQNLRNLEYDLTMAIMKVSRDSEPHIGIVKMDTMPDLPPQYEDKVDMSSSTKKKNEQLIETLRNTYKVSIVDISGGEPIDSSIKTLIVPGVENLSTRKLFEIDQFFMRGGKLIVLAEAVGVQFQYGVRAVPQESKLFDMLEKYGVRVEKSLILDPSCGQVTVPQKYGPFQMNVAVPYPYFVRVGKTGFDQDNPAVSPISEIVLPWASPITLLVDKEDSLTSESRVKAKVLAHSTEKSWLGQGTMDLNPQQDWQNVMASAASGMKEHNLVVYLNGHFESFFEGQTVPPVKDPVPGDTMSQVDIGSGNDASREVAPSTGEGHLVVVGDADLINGQNATPNNVSLVLNLVDWLSLDNNLIAIRTRAIKDRTMNADLLQEGSSKPNMIRLVNIILMPVILIIIGLVIYLRRREVAVSSGSSQTQADVATANSSKEEKKQ